MSTLNIIRRLVRIYDFITFASAHRWCLKRKFLQYGEFITNASDVLLNSAIFSSFERIIIIWKLKILWCFFLIIDKCTLIKLNTMSCTLSLARHEINRRHFTSCAVKFWSWTNLTILSLITSSCPIH